MYLAKSGVRPFFTVLELWLFNPCRDDYDFTGQTIGNYPAL